MVTSSSAASARSPASRSSRCATRTRRHLDREVQAASRTGAKVAVYRDLRRVLDDKTIDAVVIALPNHWHALATVWACQAGKDVYVEKPFSHNIWEGRQMVAAARKYGRMVQVGTQNRSSTLFRRVFERSARRRTRSHPVRPRAGVPGPRRHRHGQRAHAAAGTVDYDLWCGPAPKTPLMRKQLHYEWHWFWATGNGEMGNNGVHVIDVCRWALGQDQTPPRAMSIGGRFAFQRLRRDGQHPHRAAGLPARPANLRDPQRERGKAATRWAGSGARTGAS